MEGSLLGPEGRPSAPKPGVTRSRSRHPRASPFGLVNSLLVLIAYSANTPRRAFGSPRPTLFLTRLRGVLRGPRTSPADPGPASPSFPARHGPTRRTGRVERDRRAGRAVNPPRPVPGAGNVRPWRGKVRARSPLAVAADLGVDVVLSATARRCGRLRTARLRRDGQARYPRGTPSGCRRRPPAAPTAAPAPDGTWQTHDRRRPNCTCRD